MAYNETVFSDKNKVDLFACMPVKDYETALVWYEQLFGCPPTFSPNDREAVWDLAGHSSIYIERLPDNAGHGKQTVFLSDLDSFIAEVAKRGLDPTKRETYSNGVRKIIFHDPDGNEIGFGGAPE